MIFNMIAYILNNKKLLLKKFIFAYFLIFITSYNI